MTGRAITDEQKRAILDRVYAVWCKCHTQRLGQLLENATRGRPPVLFYREDEELVTCLEIASAGWCAEEPKQ
jgi:hypothetical protein